MSIRDTFVRVNRHRAQDRKVAFLGAVAVVVLDQVWSIAADEGEATWSGDDPIDVVAPSSALDPRDLLVELPRHSDFTLASVEAAIADLEANELIVREGDDVRVPGLGRYQSKRFRERERKRRSRAEADEVSQGQSSGQAADKAPLSQGRIPSGGGVEGQGKDVEPTTDLPWPEPRPVQSPESKKARKPRAKAKPSGLHAEFRDWWCAEFERVKGVPYAFQGAKDGRCVKTMLGYARDDLDVLKARATALLTTADPWLAERADLAMLCSSWNKLASAGRGPVNGRAAPVADAAYFENLPPDGRMQI